MFESILMLGYEFTVSVVPFVIMLAISVYVSGKHGAVFKPSYFAEVAIFAIYIIGVFHFTGVGTAVDCRIYRLGTNVNLIPFSQGFDLITYMLNIALMVPFGLLVPLIWKRFASWPKIMVVSLAFILLIELSQLLNPRATDVDDVIMNMIGAAIGYLIFLVAKSARCRTGGDHAAVSSGFSENKDPIFASKGAPSYQLPLFVAAMFLGRYFLFNEIGFASLIYGF